MLPSPDARHAPFADRGEVCAGRAGTVRARRGERGAVLVHAAVAITGLLAFSALTIDLGSVWVIRAQAQNAADAAALAGTVSLAYVSPTDTDAARAAAQAIVQAHRVWGETIPAAAVAVTTGTCPAGAPAMTGQCVNVTVGRGAAYGTPLPTFFSRLVGGTATNVRASASGKVLTGNSTSCLRPLAIVDRWYDRVGPTDAFNGYDQEGTFTPPGDVYQPPDAGGAGTGMTVASMVGQSIVREVYDPFSPTAIPEDALLAYDLPRPGMESDIDQDVMDRYEANIGTCSGATTSLGASVPAFHVHRADYTARPLQRLIELDPGATWDPVRREVISEHGISPRIVTIGVADPEAFSRQRRIPPGGGGARVATVPLTLRNFVGFFIERVQSSGGRGAVQVTGRIVLIPGQFDQRAPTITADAAFLRSVALVR